MNVRRTESRLPTLYEQNPVCINDLFRRLAERLDAKIPYSRRVAPNEYERTGAQRLPPLRQYAPDTCSDTRRQIGGYVNSRHNFQVEAPHRRIVLEHVQDEAFLNRLLHRVRVERTVLYRTVRLRVRVAEDLKGLGNLSLEPGEELAPRRTILGERQRFGGLGLRCAKESGEMNEIDAMLAVVVVGIATNPAHTPVRGERLRNGTARSRLAGMTAQRCADQAFKALFAGVCCPVTPTERALR